MEGYRGRWRCSVLAWCVLGMAAVLSGCGGSGDVVIQQGTVSRGSSTPEGVSWNFGEKKVTLNVKAAPDLNFWEGQSHTVLLCVYQLSDMISFKQFSAKEEGLLKLLRCESFDATVKQFNRHVISPGQVSSLVYDRMEGTRYVGLVAGFNKLDPAGSARTWSVPLTTKTKGWVFRDTYYYPAPLDMAIMLGADSIQKSGDKTGDKP
ncbi:MAG: type VI secretion system lipoprotein TssJ [Burkholderiaceae bacterium]|jgi:type VI secretion system VasD/TssJ family lipoprotein|nr:type VI secretion system lipoprotein TssJ [Burkholderiaceae bacterium]